jgi:hypothetical protein
MPSIAASLSRLEIESVHSAIACWHLACSGDGARRELLRANLVPSAKSAEHALEACHERTPMNDRSTTPTPPPAPEDLVRLPGLFRRWELSQVIDADREFIVEEAGEDQSGTKLFRIFCRRRHAGGDEPRARAAAAVRGGA